MGTGAATGALAGGLLGGAAGWLIGIGALAIPGVGPIIAAGPLAAALGGAALGAAGGGLIGALTGAGVPEEEAKWYDERVRSGSILLTVRAAGRTEEAHSILLRNGGRDYAAGSSTTEPRSWSEASPEMRKHYESQYGSSQSWEETEPAHRFGYEAYGKRRDPGAQGGWSASEAQLRKDWEAEGRGSWEENRGHIRHGYDYGRGRSKFRDDDDKAVTGGGAVTGGTVGAVGGAVVGGPAGAAAGAAVGGAAGAAGGKATSDSDDEGDESQARRAATDDDERLRKGSV